MPALAGDPYIIAGIAATITAGATLLGLHWKNQHELRLKQLDIQQKKEEQVRAEQAGQRAKKIELAETIGKQLALTLTTLQAKERLFKDMLRTDQDYGEGDVDYQLQSFLITADAVNRALPIDKIVDSNASLHTYFIQLSSPSNGNEADFFANLSDSEAQSIRAIQTLITEIKILIAEHGEEVKDQREQEIFDRKIRDKNKIMDIHINSSISYNRLRMQAYHMGISNIQKIVAQLGG